MCHFTFAQVCWCLWPFPSAWEMVLYPRCARTLQLDAISGHVGPMDFGWGCLTEFYQFQMVPSLFRSFVPSSIIVSLFSLLFFLFPFFFTFFFSFLSFFLSFLSFLSFLFFLSLAPSLSLSISPLYIIYKVI